jgi:sugar phosphate isomerase/epimerase
METINARLKEEEHIMIKGLTTAGIGNVGNLENFVALASRYGFGAVDTGGGALQELMDKRGVDGARAFLDEHRVQIGTIGLPVEWRQSEEKFREGLKNVARDAEAASKLGCTTCCTYVLPSTDYNAAHFMAVATRRLKTCAQILGAYDIRFGVEFVGPHHLRTAWKNPFIWDIQSTLDWIDAIGERNVGLLFDCYHWYTNEGTIDDILRLKADQIVHVHINDARDVPIPEVLDNDRLYPGEGVIDLTAFLQGLRQIGYEGPVSQEILTKEPVQGTAEELLQKSADAFRKVFAAAGLE